MEWLLVLLAVIHPFINAEEDCYDELGCFPTDPPWTSFTRPFPKPWNRSDIDTQLFSYTRNSHNKSVKLYPNIDLNGSDFNPNRNKTVFICHGFASSSETPWMSEMKDAILKKEDVNVFIVDWGKGAKHINYLQVASNTRIVGADLARFVKHLIREYNMNPNIIHLIGHSLGAHIMAYCSKRIRDDQENNPDKRKIGVIRALDPANPGFDGEPELVRLDRSDGDFVEVCHTSARPLETLGFGMMTAVGHVDIFMNGGMLQPGCLILPVTELKKTLFPLDNSSGFKINNTMDILTWPVEELAKWVSCSHGRAIKYYISAISSDSSNCTIIGRLSATARDAYSPTLLLPVTSSVTTCTLETCIPFPSDPNRFPGRGTFSANTTSEPPYCSNGTDNEKFAKYLKHSLGEPEKLVTGFIDTISTAGSKLNPFKSFG